MTQSAKRRRKPPGLGRIIGWGGSALVALTTVVYVSQTDTGAARLETALLGTDSAPATPLAAAATTAPATTTANIAAPADIKRLTDQVLNLTADRDRLAARLASLEQYMTDTTGSIGPRPAAAQPATSGPSPAEIAAEKPAEIAPSLVLNPNVLPKLAAIAAPASDAPGMIEPLAMLGAGSEKALWNEPETPASAPEKPAETAPVIVHVPLPPVRVAVTPAAAQKPPSPPRLDYAVDIGGSITTDNIAAQWMAVKANLGPLLTGLRPVVGRDHRFGRVPYRLVVGPLANPATAARLCERLTETGLACRPTRFEGQQLAQF